MIGEKSEYWFHYLEQVTFSLNIRPRNTTNYSAFELMNGCRKPRLPNEVEDLQFLYPDVFNTDASLDTDDSQKDNLVQFMKSTQDQSFHEAGKSLIKSKEILKKQYDKKVNPITNTFKASDKVLIENMSTKRRKGGKLQAKWIGPFPITKVSNSCVQVCRNKAVQRVKRSKVRLWKDRHEIKDLSQHIKLEESILSKDKIISRDEILEPTHSPILSPEEFSSVNQMNARSKEQIINQLLLIKDEVLECLRTNTPLSPLHAELDKRRNMNYVDLLDCRLDHYPSVHNENKNVAYAYYEISMIVKEWYLQRKLCTRPHF